MKSVVTIAALTAMTSILVAAQAQTPHRLLSVTGVVANDATVDVPDGTVDDWNIMVTGGDTVGTGYYLRHFNFSAKPINQTSFKITGICTDTTGSTFAVKAKYLLVRKYID
jgi:hypothetical protein